MSYQPPVTAVGSALHDTVTATLRARGISEETPGYRDAYLALASEQSGRVDPMTRPLGPSGWAVRKAVENEIGEQAHANLVNRQGTYTQPEYHREIARLTAVVRRQIDNPKEAS